MSPLTPRLGVCVCDDDGPDGAWAWTDGAKLECDDCRAPSESCDASEKADVELMFRTCIDPDVATSASESIEPRRPDR